ncbi:MAG: endonuclease/exonuclease/phosphatase family protein [bacterium]
MQHRPLRLMTFNLLTSTKMRRSHPWQLRKRSVARIFERYQPDVIGTQEANLPQLLELAELLPEYEFLGEGNLSGLEATHSPKNWYCAIFFRRDRVRPAEEESDTYWFSPTPEVPASQFHLGTRPRLVTWQTFEHIPDGQEFIFGTTHLEALNRWHRHKSAGLLRAYITSKLQQKGSDTPLFLTGDFNAVDSSPEIQALARLGANQTWRDPDDQPQFLYDAWLEAGSTDRDAGATFRGLGRMGQLNQALLGPRRIDYIFFRPQLEVVRVEKIDFDRFTNRRGSLPSDHFPVLADIRLEQAVLDEVVARN